MPDTPRAAGKLALNPNRYRISEKAAPPAGSRHAYLSLRSESGQRSAQTGARQLSVERLSFFEGVAGP